MLSGKLEEALAVLDSGLISDKGGFGLLFHKALVVNELGRSDEAVALLSEIDMADCSPDRKNLLLAFRGLFLFDQGKFSEARHQLDCVQGSRLARSFELLLLLHNKEFDLAGDHIQTYGLPDSPHFKVRLFAIIETQMLTGETISDEELTKITTATEATEKTKATLIWEEGVKAFEAGDEKRALQQFLRGHHYYPDDLEFVIGLAEIYSVFGRFEQSEAFHEKAQAMVVPQAKASKIGLSKFFAWFARPNEEDTTWVEYYYAKHRVRRGEAQQAIEVFESLLKKNSNNVECAMEIAIAHLARNDMRKALSAFANNLSIDSDSFPMRLDRYLNKFCNLEIAKKKI